MHRKGGEGGRRGRRVMNRKKKKETPRLGGGCLRGAPPLCIFFFSVPVKIREFGWYRKHEARINDREACREKRVLGEELSS
jgi:hypothetical protein